MGKGHKDDRKAEAEAASDVARWLTDAGPPSAEAAPASRRRHERQAMFTGVTVFEQDEHGVPCAGWPCDAVNVSRSGLGLRSRRMVLAGRRVFVRLEMGGGRARLLYGCVRYTRYDRGGLHHIGVEFEQVPAAEKIRRWMAQQGAA